jgi:nucleotide-binding universal stress UspA family protein
MTFSNILVATDFSVEADLALTTAVALAKQVGATVHVVSIVEDPAMSAAWSEGYAYDLAKLRDMLVEDAERRLAALAAADPDFHPTTEVIVGHPADTIVRTAAARGADLVVVGTRGRSGITRMLMGSVADRVVHLAWCPVLTVRALSRDAARERAAVEPARATA